MPHVLEVALEEAERLAVVRRPDHLREVDDDRAAPAAEDVVGREVAVDEVAAEHPHHLRAQIGVQLDGVLALHVCVDQARRGSALGVHHQLHEEDALVEEDRARHAHPGGVQRVQRVGLLRLPGLLLRRLAEAAAAGHRALRARISDLPPFLVDGVVLEAARLPGLVHLGRDELAAVADEPQVRLLATLQAGDDLVDDAVG